MKTYITGYNKNGLRVDGYVELGELRPYNQWHREYRLAKLGFIKIKEKRL